MTCGSVARCCPRPVEIDIGSTAIDQNFGYFFFKDARADAFVGELSTGFAFEL